MTKPEFNTSISLGNLIQIGTMILAIGVGWAIVDQRGQTNAESIEANTRDVNALELRVRTLENGSARLSEQISGLRADVARTNADINRVLTILERSSR